MHEIDCIPSHRLCHLAIALCMLVLPLEDLGQLTRFIPDTSSTTSSEAQAEPALLAQARAHIGVGYGRTPC